MGGRCAGGECHLAQHPHEHYKEEGKREAREQDQLSMLAETAQQQEEQRKQKEELLNHRLSQRRGKAKAGL